MKGRPKVDFSWARSPAPQPQSRSPLAAVRSPQPEYRNPLALVQIPQSASRSPLAAVQVGESEFCSPLVADLSTPPVPCQVCIKMVMSEILTRKVKVAVMIMWCWSVTSIVTMIGYSDNKWDKSKSDSTYQELGCPPVPQRTQRPVEGKVILISHLSFHFMFTE